MALSTIRHMQRIGDVSQEDLSKDPGGLRFEEPSPQVRQISCVQGASLETQVFVWLSRLLSGCCQLPMGCPHIVLDGFVHSG